MTAPAPHPDVLHRAGAPAASIPRTASRWIGLCGLLLVASLLPPQAAHAEDSPTQTLVKRYAALRTREEFSAFEERMAVIRSLGRVRTPASQAALLRIVETSRRLDDEVVGILALGPALDREQALALARFLRRRGGAARTQALATAYAAAEDAGVRAWLADAGLSCKDPQALLAVLRSQAFHADPRALDRLLVVYEEEKDRKRHVDQTVASVRAIGSIGALSGDESRRIRRALLRAGRHPDPRVRMAVAEVTPQQELDLNLRPLMRDLLRDENAVVRQSASRSLGQAGVVELVPEIAALLEDERLKTREVAYEALVRITGQDLGFDAGHWKAWFEHRSESEAPAKTTPYAQEAATYYGVRVHSDRVLFVVDLSGSMSFPWGQETTRLDVARRELTRALKALAPGTLFNILVFSDSVATWRRSEATAAPDTIARAVEWVEKAFREPRGGTFLYSALEKAFEQNLHVDTILFLSDGLATDGEPMAPEAILASVHAWNRYRRVTIHTFALTLEKVEQKGSEDEDFTAVKAFMRKLARMTGGTAHVIDDVPAPRGAAPGDDGAAKQAAPGEGDR